MVHTILRRWKDKAHSRVKKGKQKMLVCSSESNQTISCIELEFQCEPSFQCGRNGGKIG